MAACRLEEKVMLRNAILGTLCVILPLCSQAQLQKDTDFLVKLRAPGINTKTAAAGDEIRAVVEQPAPYAGYELIGHISQAKNEGKLKGKSVLIFKFENLVKGSATIPVSAVLKQVTNSKGAPNVDEEGRMVRTKNHVKSVAGTALGGALIGGLLGGGKGAAIGALAGAAAGAGAVEIGTEKGAGFDLGADSRLLVSISPARADALPTQPTR
jgi:hypothetical protein